MELFLSVSVFSTALVIIAHMLTTREIRLSTRTQLTQVEERQATVSPISTQELNEEIRSAYEMTRRIQELFLDDDQLAKEDTDGH